ncbi:unnamed protein product [Pieris brassicae]|uniref:Uncharacterized protein n=1 Tax=Pieris brassicae TaxID=7116 RepID=A0A9P0SY66_PIEBR|nr:unnamed protein product [Pieris brassicae]
MLHFVVFLWLSSVNCSNQEVISQLITSPPLQLSARSSDAPVLHDGSNEPLVNATVNSENLPYSNTSREIAICNIDTKMSDSKQPTKNLTSVKDNEIGEPADSKTSNSTEEDSTKNMEDPKNNSTLQPHNIALNNITFENRDSINGDTCPTGYVKVNEKCVKIQ